MVSLLSGLAASGIAAAVDWRPAVAVLVAAVLTVAALRLRGRLAAWLVERLTEPVVSVRPPAPARRPASIGWLVEPVEHLSRPGA